MIPRATGPLAQSSRIPCRVQFVILYERARPGELPHLNTKKPRSFNTPGHRTTDDRTQKTPQAGPKALHVRFSLMLVAEIDEQAGSACAHSLETLPYSQAGNQSEEYHPPATPTDVMEIASLETTIGTTYCNYATIGKEN